MAGNILQDILAAGNFFAQLKGAQQTRQEYVTQQKQAALQQAAEEQRRQQQLDMQQQQLEWQMGTEGREATADFQSTIGAWQGAVPGSNVGITPSAEQFAAAYAPDSVSVADMPRLTGQFKAQTAQTVVARTKSQQDAEAAKSAYNAYLADYNLYKPADGTVPQGEEETKALQSFQRITAPEALRGKSTEAIIAAHGQLKQYGQTHPLVEKTPAGVQGAASKAYTWAGRLEPYLDQMTAPQRDAYTQNLPTEADDPQELIRKSGVMEGLATSMGLAQNGQMQPANIAKTEATMPGAIQETRAQGALADMMPQWEAIKQAPTDAGGKQYRAEVDARLAKATTTQEKAGILAQEINKWSKRVLGGFAIDYGPNGYANKLSTLAGQNLAAVRARLAPLALDVQEGRLSVSQGQLGVAAGSLGLRRDQFGHEISEDEYWRTHAKPQNPRAPRAGSSKPAGSSTLDVDSLLGF
jgi:hypothetical protein